MLAIGKEIPIFCFKSAICQVVLHLFMIVLYCDNYY